MTLKFPDFHEQLKQIKSQIPYTAEKLENISIKLEDLSEKLNYKSCCWPISDLIKSCDEVIGSLNKLLFPLYKRKALAEAKTGEKISLLEPPSDLEGLSKDDIKFIIGEMENKEGISGWFDLTENVIYKAAETHRAFYPISILSLLLGGSALVWIFDALKLNEILTSSTIQYQLSELIVFYLFGTLGFLIHLYKLIGGSKSRITCVDDFLNWFSSRWTSFLWMVLIFWLGFLLLVSSDQASRLNSILLGYSIDSLSEVILNRYGSLVSTGTKDLSMKVFSYEKL